ncbi:MAG: ABC transporter ATP-binding protein [Deltaproteobacteria bacterium]|jgi:NitT/TauT family transport system ATP-binding protein|nr:ABC transporter ATP-binding protein [Deltaproteobacteria bacterium]
MGATLAARDLGRSYGDREVLRGVSFTVPAGGSLSVVGRSGSGKTTLLNLLAGLVGPGRSAGEVATDPPGAGRAYLMQGCALFPWKTVAANLELPLALAGASRRERGARVAEALRELGLEGLGHRYPHEISGGERQRAALGRALAAGAEVVLLDEPFSALDAIARERLQDAVDSLFARKGLTSVVATHGIDEAVRLGDRVLVLGGRPSGITAEIPNPRRRESGFRSSEAAFRLALEIRRALEDGT